VQEHQERLRLYQDGLWPQALRASVLQWPDVQFEG
jgi:hypothetical protein